MSSPIQAALQAGGPLSPLAAFRQFILVKLVQRADGKTDKFPFSLDQMQVVSAHDPAHWLTADDALMQLSMMGDGYCLGFVFTTADPFWFLDIDSAWNGSEWSQLAGSLCQRLQGAAVEVSQSGRGLHLFGSGMVPAHGCKNVPLHLELYTEGRFVALTGLHAAGLASWDGSAVMPALVAEYFPGGEERAEQEWSDQPVPEYGPAKSDAEVLDRAIGSLGAVGAVRFASLWNADPTELARRYPHESRAWDESSADGALAMQLAFWTGKNCEQMLRLMWQSKLVRPKWTKHRTYLQRTILSACAAVNGVYGAAKRAEVVEPDPRGPVAAEPLHPVASGEIRTGIQLLSVTQQIEHFAGCVYVKSLHRVMMPGGDLLKPEQFKVVKGGYEFAMDPANFRVVRNAWEAFSESQAYHSPKVDSLCFRPKEAPGAIVHEGRRSMVNTYWPEQTPRRAGDISRFLRHAELLLPNERDREILLSYMAACVQLKGDKFQWCPLIQGTEGNGKTLFTRCVMEAIGKRHTHWPKASQLDSQFNGWLLNKLFIGVEDVYVPASRLELWETLKPMITGGDGLEIQFKGADQISADVCANFMLNSNHKDAVRKQAADRRLAVFYTAQQSKEDCFRAGMDDDYFASLYDWLRDEGYAFVHEYLATRPITVNVFGKAPETSSTTEAIDLSMGNTERAILDAIDEGRPGFRDGLVSTEAIRDMVKQETGRDIGQGEMTRALATLGFVKHKILGNSGKIRIGSKLLRIYVKADSLAANFDSLDGLRNFWMKSQTLIHPVPAPVPGVERM